MVDFSYTGERLANAIGLLKGTSVERHTHGDLGRGSAGASEVFHGSIGAHASLSTTVQVGLVVCPSEPRTGVVVSLSKRLVVISGLEEKEFTIKFQKSNALSIWGTTRWA